MDKELEKIKRIVAIHFGALGFLNPSENEQILKDRDKVLNTLQRLESIENTESSEALYCVDFLKEDGCITTLMQGKGLEIIRQALIKAQEQEKVLEIIKEKWVNVAVLIHSKTVEEYNNNAHTPYNLTQEEFELLKEVLR